MIDDYTRKLFTFGQISAMAKEIEQGENRAIVKKELNQDNCSTYKIMKINVLYFCMGGLTHFANNKQSNVAAGAACRSSFLVQW